MLNVVLVGFLRFVTHMQPRSGGCASATRKIVYLSIPTCQRHGTMVWVMLVRVLYVVAHTILPSRSTCKLEILHQIKSRHVNIMAWTNGVGMRSVGG